MTCRHNTRLYCTDFPVPGTFQRVVESNILFLKANQDTCNLLFERPWKLLSCKIIKLIMDQSYSLIKYSKTQTQRGLPCCRHPAAFAARTGKTSEKLQACRRPLSTSWVFWTIYCFSPMWLMHIFAKHTILNWV